MGFALRCCQAQVLSVAILIALVPSYMTAQTCQKASDMDATARTAITTAGQRYFGFAARGDVASLRQGSIPSLASDFAGIETTIKDHQQALTGAQPILKDSFLLNADHAPPNQRQEFYCGVFGKNGQT